MIQYLLTIFTMKFLSLPSINLLIGIFIYFCSFSGHTETVNNTHFNHPGGVVEIFIDKKNTFLPEVQYGINEPTIIEEENNWRILIGLGLDTIPGEYLIYLKHNVDDASSEHIKFFVEQKNYPIKVVEKKSNKTIKKAHSTLTKLDFENTQQPNLPLNLPVKGNWDLGFGTIFYNKKSKKTNIQNQISLETSSIINVRSPENALVSNIITEKDDSSTVFLDHGRGLYSVISGITDLNIEIGNGVLSGAVIGKVTPTANLKKSTVATNTLTWQCILNGIYVNPAILTQL